MEEKKYLLIYVEWEEGELVAIKSQQRREDQLGSQQKLEKPGKGLMLTKKGDIEQPINFFGVVFMILAKPLLQVENMDLPRQIMKSLEKFSNLKIGPEVLRRERQLGDPISLYLFVLVMEVLLGLLEYRWVRSPWLDLARINFMLSQRSPNLDKCCMFLCGIKIDLKVQLLDKEGYLFRKLLLCYGKEVTVIQVMLRLLGIQFALPKEKGRLGVKNIEMWNIYKLVKSIWSSWSHLSNSREEYLGYSMSGELFLELEEDSRLSQHCLEIYSLSCRDAKLSCVIEVFGMNYDSNVSFLIDNALGTLCIGFTKMNANCSLEMKTPLTLLSYPILSYKPNNHDSTTLLYYLQFLLWLVSTSLSISLITLQNSSYHGRRSEMSEYEINNGEDNINRDDERSSVWEMGLSTPDELAPLSNC
ncbi:hypothetical protein SADUNF_Sadunf05G0111300 [Salix dunnii]|uniref:Uncharacterized protein n=1 Tax=Salix dunnii TaxID=1413687 RepID=A0A835N273_9ROSI|nr:hypothetical protein SADUNF_Sadunf05G0111300 [Salix dunnii]